MQVKEVLTARELELVKLAALGMKNRHIAWRVGLAEETVKHSFVTIFDKTGTWSRLEVVVKWVGEQTREETSASLPESLTGTTLPLRPSSQASSSQTP